MRQIKTSLRMQAKAPGFTMIELLLSIAIFGVASFVVLNQTKNQLDQLKSLDLSLQINSIREEFVRRVDCARTLATYRDPVTGSVSCGAGFQLLDVGGAPILDGSGHLIDGDSRWAFSSSCGARSIHVLGTLRQGGKVVKDALLGTINAANSRINPILGSNVAYKLCPHMFGKGARVESFTTTLAALPVAPPLTSADCVNMSDRPFAMHLTETVPYLLRGINGCSRFCTQKGFFSGFMSYCDAVNTTCECLR
jgi:prepilin-type N-terminal cleavage/methylation domain-containing protein